MKALVLAAGYATRLYPLTKDFPKPLLKVNNKAIIDYIIAKIDGLEEVNEVIVVTNDKFYERFRQWRRNVKSGKKVKILNDLTKSNEDRKGAIGDIGFAIENENIAEDLLVIGGDNLFTGGLQDFIRSARLRAACSLGVFDIKDKNSAKKYGVLKIGKGHKIIELKEKPDSPKSSLVAMCLYYFPREKLGLIKEYLQAKKGKKDATGCYLEWLLKREAVYGFVFKGEWFDIGHPDFYNRAKKAFSERREI